MTSCLCILDIKTRLAEQYKMEVYFTIFGCFSLFILLIAGILCVLYVIILMEIRDKKPKRTVPKNTVLVHQLPRNGRVLNVSPPCFKLEVFLRMARISYENHFTFTLSNKGKLPWIEYNGETIADSNFVIRYLSKKLDVDVDSHLSSSERALSHTTMTMLEENTYWVLMYCYFIDDPPGALEMSPLFVPMKFPMKQIAFHIAQQRFRGYLNSHGIGRHTRDEIYAIGENDLRAVSRLLGNKRFMFGDRVSFLDAVVFALVACFLWNVPKCPVTEVIKIELKNLEQHSLLMKEKYFSDWEELICKQL